MVPWLSFGPAGKTRVIQKVVDVVEPAVSTANSIAEDIHGRLEDAEPENLLAYINILTNIQSIITGEMNDLSSRINELNNNNSTGFYTQEIASQTRGLFVLEDYLAPVKSELRLATPIFTKKNIKQ